MLHMARQVAVEYILFLTISRAYGFIKVLGKIFLRVCKILSIGILLNPRWPPRLTNIIKMVITLQIFGQETKYLALYPGFDAQGIYWNGYFYNLTIL